MTSESPGLRHESERRQVAHLRRERGTIVEVVVVDNGSEDGSRELARCLADAGIVRFIDNDAQHYHGPGLTQGANLLAGLAADARPVDLIWALDTDVLVLRPDALRAAGTAMCTLFDPAIVWQAGNHPFLEDGEPSRHMQADLIRDRHRLLAFPFCGDAYVLHLGRSTLAQVAARNAANNRYHSWAVRRHQPHFALRRDGAELARQFEERYRTAVPDDNIDTLVAALRGMS